MNSKNSINKNNANSENTKQNDNESINNFSNVKNIGKNRKRQRKKANSDDPKNYSIAKTNFTTNKFTEKNKNDKKLPTLLEQHNGEDIQKYLNDDNNNKNSNNNNKVNNNKIPLQEKDIYKDDEDDNDDNDYKMSKEEKETFEKEYKTVTGKLEKNNDFVIIIKNFKLFDESKNKCFDDILYLNKKRYKSDDN